MAVGRAERMAELVPRIHAEFGVALARQVVAVLTLAEFAWHDCYGEPSPPAGVVDDIFVVANGDLGRLAEAARQAVLDYRDLRLEADAMRAKRDA